MEDQKANKSLVIVGGYGHQSALLPVFDIKTEEENQSHLRKSFTPLDYNDQY